VQACVARGAAAFVHKTIGPRELADVIRKAMACEEFFSLGNTSLGAPQHDVELTPREMEILRALADGLPNKQIARKLMLSEQTIKYHLTNMYRKLRVTSRTEAIRYAYDHGLLESPVLRVAAALA
jgi:DNA-binding NarL/FixJ family response regulator